MGEKIWTLMDLEWTLRHVFDIFGGEKMGKAMAILPLLWPFPPGSMLKTGPARKCTHSKGR